MYVVHIMEGSPGRLEILGVDITRLCDPEEIERSVDEALEGHQRSIQFRIDSMQADIDRAKAEGRAEP